MRFISCENYVTSFQRRQYSSIVRSQVIASFPSVRSEILRYALSSCQFAVLIISTMNDFAYNFFHTPVILSATIRQSV